MQCLITALKAESYPLIKFFDLKKDNTFKFPFFINMEKDIALVGVGVGKKNIKYRLKNVYQRMNEREIQFINIGVAGGRKNQVDIGQLFIINKIVDEYSGKVFYPDILTRNSIIETSITTVENVVQDGGERFDSIVDMEASEIFDVCSKIVSVHNIAYLKVISDHMINDNKNLNYQMISTLINKNLNDIKLFINRFKNLAEIRNQLLSDKDIDWVYMNKKRYSFTESQIHLLLKSVKGFRAINSNTELPYLCFETPNSKTDGKKILQNIREKLKT